MFKLGNILSSVVFNKFHCRQKSRKITLRCVIPVVCVTNEREESVVNQHN